MKKIDSSDVYGTLIALAIAGFLAWSIFFSNKPAETTTQTQSNTTQPQQYNSPTNITPPVQTPEPSTANTDNNENYQLCEVHLMNTLNGTDKTGGYKAIMDLGSKTLRLQYVGNEKEVIEIHYNGGGLNTMKLYHDGVVETEKTLYRRTDLEPNDKVIVYTSRTEQIKIIISYN